MEMNVWHATTLLGAMVGVCAFMFNSKLSPWILVPGAYLFGISVFTGMYHTDNYMDKLFYYLQLSSDRLALIILLVGAVLQSKWRNQVMWLVITLHLSLLPLLIFCGVSPYVGASHDALAVSIFLPFLFRVRPGPYRWKQVLLVLSTLSILYVHQATALVVLAAYVFYFLVVKADELVQGVGVVTLFCIGTWKWDDISIVKQRGALWAPYLRFMREHASPWLGLGPNSFEGISSAHGAVLSSFGSRRWMHGDWIQCLFEFGILGLVSMAIIYFRTLWRIKYSENFLLAWVGLGIGMVVYSPLQFWWVQLLAGYTILRGESEVSKPSKVTEASPS